MKSASLIMTASCKLNVEKQILQLDYEEYVLLCRNRVLKTKMSTVMIGDFAYDPRAWVNVGPNARTTEHVCLQEVDVGFFV